MPSVPLITPSLKARGTGESEEWLRPALNELVAAVQTHMATEHDLVLAHTFPLTPLIPDAARCISDLSYCPVSMPIPAYNLTACNPTCDWFTRDSLYSTPPSESDFLNFLLPRDRVLVVVGVNHAALGKATFTNFLMTGIRNPERPGHTPNFSSSHLAGSGQYYLPSQRPESFFLYAQQLSRDCGTPARPFCELVTEECIAYDEYLFFAERVRVWVVELLRVGGGWQLGLLLFVFMQCSCQPICSWPLPAFIVLTTTLFASLTPRYPPPSSPLPPSLSSGVPGACYNCRPQPGRDDLPLHSRL